MPVPGAPISFARGAPSLDIVDVDGLREASDRAFAEDAAATVGYGTAAGFAPLREWIAERHGVPVEQVLVTNGSMQADAFLFALMVQAGDTVLVEAPTYDRTLLNLRQRGADLRPIPLQPDGIDVDAVDAVLRDGARPKLAHIIPNFQNPAGYTLSAGKRERLLELAAEYDMTIFEDDPYVAIRFEGESLPTMLEGDGAGKVVYASSFSKTVCPGIRVGFLIGPQAVIGQVQSLATNTYISPNMVAQSIVNQFCRSGRLDASVQTVRAALRERRDALVGALRRDLPQARFESPEGGYFMWVELPEEIDVAALEPAAGERGVVFVKGTDFLLEGGANAMRLAYSGVTPGEIDEGIRRLADAVASLSS
ncbi:MAG: Valine--pyruvate aminotransferase [uncultured Solirubrobacteraceae bacterium]|uniref:Valine--pyruvate aminotransferase n=1 Tax=uncultured Solirubrobacteraceae bacterium TaxID=1162706 RepID=A0A6J4RTF9_9ACTN|nr:MAG: Valine--pyruvate aminotransferase [uncultured Solirubrobacteraceae bacterium]